MSMSNVTLIYVFGFKYFSGASINLLRLIVLIDGAFGHADYCGSLPHSNIIIPLLSCQVSE